MPRHDALTVLMVYLDQGRDWQAVRSFYAGLVSGDINLGSVGLELLEPPPVSPRHETSRQASLQQCDCNAQQTYMDCGSTGSSQACTGSSLPHQEAAPSGEQRRQGQQQRVAKGRQKSDRAAFKALVSYFGPAFQGWQRQGGSAAGRSVEDAVQAGLLPVGLHAYHGLCH